MKSHWCAFSLKWECLKNEFLKFFTLNCRLLVCMNVSGEHTLFIPVTSWGYPAMRSTKIAEHVTGIPGV